ncbi:MAG: glycosyltransferase family 1 protein [Planctomycetota bacterium]|nr:glycosyltransferase family 1 protein [Planctomycetota bacterium]
MRWVESARAPRQVKQIVIHSILFVFEQEHGSPVKIGYDATSGSFPSGGVSRYAYRLAEALRQARGDDFVPVALTHHALRQRTEGVLHRRCPRRILTWLWSRELYPPFERFSGPVDLVHVPLPLPVFSRSPQVVTVHDLAWLDDPRYHPGAAPDREEMQGRFDRCAGIICVSEPVARAVRERFEVSKQQIQVIGSGNHIDRPAQGESVHERPYWITISDWNPRKNLERLLRAYLQQGSSRPDLLLLGGDDRVPPRLRELIDSTSSIRCLGRVDDSVLHQALTGARALLYPSLDEGFGHPVLEAQACGTPVLVSDIEVLRDTSGGASVFVDPHEVDSIGRGMEQLIHMEEEALQAQIEAGRQNAEGRTWERCARETWAFYERVLDCHRSD